MTEPTTTAGILKSGLGRSLKWGGCVALSGFLLLAVLSGLIFLGAENEETRWAGLTVLALGGGIFVPALSVVVGVLVGASIMAGSAVEAATQPEGAPPASGGTGDK